MQERARTLVAAAKEEDKALREWRKQSAAIRQKLDISSTYRGWTSQAGIRLLGVPKVERCKDVLDVSWSTRMRQLGLATPRKEAAKSWWTDPGQGVGRRCWGETPGTLCRNSIKYSHEFDFSLSGYDHLRLQGIPKEEPGMAYARFSDDELKDLAGEAYFLPCAAMVMFSYYLNPHSPWWKGADSD